MLSGVGPEAPCGGLTPDGPRGDVLDDPQRRDAVARLVAVLADGNVDGALDRLTRLAALLLEAPYAQVSMIGTEQEVASLHGVPADLSRRHPTPAEDSLCTVTLRAGAAVVVTDARTDPRVAHLLPVRLGGVRSYLGVPLVDGRGLRLGSLCVHDVEPRTWSAKQVGILAELAESVVVELELRALSNEAGSTLTRLSLALEASDVGSFDLDLATSRLHWDERLVELFGYDKAEFTHHRDSFTRRVHPEDRDRVEAAIARAVSTRGDLILEYRIVRPDGQVRWIESRGRVRSEPSGPGRLLGIAYDSTALREARDSLARVLETMTDAFYRLDDEWRVTYVNATAERVLRRSRDELLGRSLWESFPAALDGRFLQKYQQAIDTGLPVSFEEWVGPLDGWFELTAWPGPDGLSVYFRDITARRQVDQAREQAVTDREAAYAEAAAANTRLALLADASSVLSASLEPRQVLERLTDLVVPALGEWVAVGLSAETAALLERTETGRTDRVVVVHVGHPDPAERARLSAALRALVLTTADAHGVGAVVRTGRPEWLPTLPDEARALVADSELVTSIPGAAFTVPLVNRGRVLGAMTVMEPLAGDLDRGLLVDLAARAAIALDNALLFGAERRTGLTLQRTLLPRRMPDVPGVAMSARYLPGATGAFVGGDWFQGVEVGGSLVLAMGDVMGHGMHSAARMGQLRAIVATLALEGHSPGALLERLSSNVDVLLDLDLATLLVGALDPVSGQLTLASAGHPPPVVAPLGAAPYYVDVEPGPPLGSFPSTYAESSVLLAPGDMVVLYTDGLVEDRADALDVGLDRLRDALAALVGGQLPPEEVCDHVLRELGRESGSDDDVALLVLRRM